MNEEMILAAAAALQEFSLSQLAAYCGADSAEIRVTLETVPGLVEPVGAWNWRVVDADAIRAAVRNAESREPVSRQSCAAMASDSAELTSRLVVAEETLIECGGQDSALLRQVMAASARNSVLQIMAHITPGPEPWWRAESLVSRWNSAGTPVTHGFSPHRLRVDFELATITAREAAGQAVPADDLVRIAARMRDVLEIPVDRRLDRLFQRFVDLTMSLARPAGLSPSTEPAPTRLLIALAWRRVRAVAAQDVKRASEAVLLILRQLQREYVERDDRAAIDLCRFIERLPDGWNRLVVFRDLLELLPHPLRCQTRGDFLPGVLVEAIADPQASTRLAWIATRLHNDLDRSPFRSESALIGGAAHVLNDLAVNTAKLDDTLLPRSDRMRRQLLSLVDAPV